MEKRFEQPEEFRKWLRANHAKATEVWVVFLKKAAQKSAGKTTMSWSESVDEALCYGWIDGIRKSIDDETYKIRFTPRKPTSHWSKVNVEKMKALEASGRMRAPGRKAFARRTEAKTAQASFEREYILDDEMLARFRKRRKAWKAFQATASSYQRLCVAWVMTAKRTETQTRRLETLIDCSEEGSLIPPQRYGKNKR